MESKNGNQILESKNENQIKESNIGIKYWNQILESKNGNQILESKNGNQIKESNIGIKHGKTDIGIKPNPGILNYFYNSIPHSIQARAWS